MLQKPITKRTVLAVLPSDHDRAFLQSTFNPSSWELLFSRSLQEARTALLAPSIEVVVSEVSFSDGHCWQDLLHQIQKLESPPPLIVTDRLADEALWAEVLNLGGYDLLMKPFDALEVLRVVTMACRYREIQREPHTVLRKPPKPAANYTALVTEARSAVAGR
jgi:DNA-binding NtrC family response regulator